MEPYDEMDNMTNHNEDSSQLLFGAVFAIGLAIAFYQWFTRKETTPIDLQPRYEWHEGEPRIENE